MGVFLLDDHELVRRGVRDVLSAEEDIIVVGEASTGDEALLASILAGAAGHVLKQIRGSELVESIRRVAAGQSLLDPAATARVLDRLRAPPDDPLALLSPGERRILELI